MRILFMGTPEIAVSSLSALIDDGQTIVGVVTAPDKPAGRGRKVKSSAVKDFALENSLNILQPEKLKSVDFLEALNKLEPELIAVVAFRMLPEEVWGMPPKGSINLHASFLPQYRGAAPINRAIMNGEKETGVSTFFIEKDIDTGKVIMQEPVPIDPDDNAGILHDRIMKKGAELLVRTVRAIETGDTKEIAQSKLLNPEEKLKSAPKIHKEDCKINWNQNVQCVYDHVRGLSPYPTAWTTIVTPEGKELMLKVYASEKKDRDSVFPPGTLLSDGRNRLEVVCRSGILNLKDVQVEGKKRMEIDEFCRGFKDLSTCTIV
ncbi:MAG TPA: methionyl-tRNA formyltransferase [Bacteroides sp.]|nr:methionyl-tRNA formyltransferase [Bacteroides sp.]